MVSVMLYPCMVCVALSIDLLVLYVSCLTVFVNWLVKQFAICLGVVVILLLNVMEVFSVVGGALLDSPCMVFHVCCACDNSVRLDAPSMCFVCRKLSHHLRFRELDHRCLLFLCSFCTILHTMWSGKTLQFLCILHLSLWWVVLVCHQYDVCEKCIGSVQGYLGESRSVFHELCPIDFLVVGESPSVLL